METRLDKEGFEKLYGELPFPNRIIVKHPNLGGGLALIWNNEVQLQLVNDTANHFLVKVREDDGFEWWLTGFYGWPEACHRYKSWELLTHLRTFVEGPWLCIGDFNAIIQSTEKLSKRPSQMSQIDSFREALESCQLEDLSYKGYPYTWNNKRPRDANTKMWLDRVISIKPWRDKFQLSTVNHLFPHASDHLPIVLQTKHYGRNGPRAKSGFKFEEKWLLWEDCETVIKAWSVDMGGMHGMARLKQKIEACGADLRAWGSSKSKPNDEEIKQIKKQLEVMGTKIQIFFILKHLKGEGGIISMELKM